MSSDTKTGRPGTRWLRFGITMAATGIAAAALVGLTAEGVLAASFSISGTPFVVTSSELNGNGFEQFAALDNMPDNSPNAGDTNGQILVVVSAIKDATLTNLCQSIELPGTFLKITAGDNGTPVSANTLVVDSDQISGNASFTNISIGQDSSTLTEVKDASGNPVTGNIGVFGQQADTVKLTNVRQNNFATTAALFSLPNLHISFSDTGC